MIWNVSVKRRQTHVLNNKCKWCPPLQHKRFMETCDPCVFRKRRRLVAVVTVNSVAVMWLDWQLNSQISADLISSLKNIISCCDLWRRAHGHGPQGSEVTELRLTISQKLVRVYEEQELWCVTSGLFETQLRKTLSTEVMRFSMQPCPETLICMLTLYSKVWVWMPRTKNGQHVMFRSRCILQCSFILCIYIYHYRVILINYIYLLCRYF